MVIVAYRPMEKIEQRRLKPRPDPRPELQAEERQAYDALRTWRAERAKMEGIPPYMIASNRQLARMIRMRARSRTALTRIEGIGEAKAGKYGEGILSKAKPRRPLKAWSPKRARKILHFSGRAPLTLALKHSASKGGHIFRPLPGDRPADRAAAGPWSAVSGGHRRLGFRQVLSGSCRAYTAVKGRRASRQYRLAGHFVQTRRVRRPGRQLPLPLPCSDLESAHRGYGTTGSGSGPRPARKPGVVFQPCRPGLVGAATLLPSFMPMDPKDSFRAVSFQWSAF